MTESNGKQAVVVSYNMLGSEQPISWSVLKISGPNQELISKGSEYITQFDIEIFEVNPGDIYIIFVGKGGNQGAYE